MPGMMALPRVTQYRQQYFYFGHSVDGATGLVFKKIPTPLKNQFWFSCSVGICISDTGCNSFVSELSAVFEKRLHFLNNISSSFS